MVFFCYKVVTLQFFSLIILTGLGELEPLEKQNDLSYLHNKKPPNRRFREIAVAVFFKTRTVRCTIYFKKVIMYI